LGTGVLTEGVEDGSLPIAVKIDQRLHFAYPGYRTDALVVIGFDRKRVYLTPAGSPIQGGEAQMQAMTDSRLEAEIKRAQEEGKFTDVSQRRGGVRISPSRWFGK